MQPEKKTKVTVHSIHNEEIPDEEVFDHGYHRPVREARTVEQIRKDYLVKRTMKMVRNSHHFQEYVALHAEELVDEYKKLMEEVKDRIKDSMIKEADRLARRQLDPMLENMVDEVLNETL